MGSSASKPARSAAQAASRRQYPKQPSTPSPSPATTRPPPSPAATASQQPPQPQYRAPERPPKSAGPIPGPKYHSNEQASLEKSSAIDLDGRDPHFAASLRSLGPVTPTPTLSNSSTFNKAHPPQHPGATVFPTAPNPALLVLSARQRIASEAEAEAEDVGKGSFAGRRYLDAYTIRQVLEMRDRRGLGAGEIERELRLREGVVGALGGRDGVWGIP
ncbi:hypothetical protein BJX61DRAFT_125903 [Aspergillus egyptiacus]|nr:hypothetical protein BJX61DRAFT_125903 [Aspergillus egyptiacus]